MSSSNLLQLQNGNKGFGGQKLFLDAGFSINQGEHVGVIGPNGAGKTTLFRILNNEEDLDGGQLIRSKELSIGYLSQHDHWLPGETGDEYLGRVTKIPLWQAKAAGRDLLLTEEIYAQPISNLSGGYRMRIKLVGLLGQDPNLMLLDEPTNYLDLETTLLLEKFLQNFSGAFLLISHDREFLRRTTDHTLEVEAGDITKFNGNIDDYFEQKGALREQLAARAQSLAEKRQSIIEFVNRFGAKATKAKQAQSRLKSLEKMEVIELKSIPVGAAIRIPAPSHVGKSVLKLEKANLGYENKIILKNVNLEIQKGNHVAVVGLNGAGKSTLLKSLAGNISLVSGLREVGYQVNLAIFNQHVAETLQPDHTVIESLSQGAHKDVAWQDVLDMAGSLLFTGDHMRKRVSVLSGGEKSRVALGRILLQKAPCLLLDEPTNHLDFQTVEALTQALEKYAGTFVVVSHDRGFIRRISTKILEVSDGSVLLYPGTYDEYVWSLQQRIRDSSLAPSPQSLSTTSKPAISNPIDSKSQRKERDRQLRELDKKIRQLESELHMKETENAELNVKIMEQPSSELVTKLAANAQRISEIEEAWTKATDELAILQQRD